MSISHRDLPRDGRGRQTSGTWLVELDDAKRQIRFARATFEDSRTTRPMKGRDLMRLAAAMGRRIKGAIRVEDGFEVGERLPWARAQIGIDDRPARVLELLSAIRLNADVLGMGVSDEDFALASKALTEDVDLDGVIATLEEQLAESEAQVEALGANDDAGDAGDAPQDAPPGVAQGAPPPATPADPAQDPAGAKQEVATAESVGEATPPGADTAPPPAPEPAADPLAAVDVSDKKALRAYCDERGISALVDFRLGAEKLAEAIREVERTLSA